jgi:hypothetical protein
MTHLHIAGHEFHSLVIALAAAAMVFVWRRPPAMSPRRLAVESRGIVRDATTAPADRRVAFFTSLLRLASGRVIAGFQVGPSKNSPAGTIGLASSEDGGSSWRPLSAEFATRLDGVPGSLSCAELVEVEPGRLLLFATWFDRSDPGRPLFDPATSGILHSRQLVAESADDGATWGGWRIVPTGDLRGCSLTGPVLRWADGTIAVPFESYREFDDPDPRHHSAWVVVSRDGGRTFSDPVNVARHPEDRVYYWDQRLCASGADGGFTALFWSHDLADKRDLPVHMLRGRITEGQVGQWHFGKRRPSGTGHEEQQPEPVGLDADRLWRFRGASYPRSRPDFSCRRRPVLKPLFLRAVRTVTWDPVRGCECRSRAVRRATSESRRIRRGPARALPSRSADHGRERWAEVRAVRRGV